MASAAISAKKSRILYCEGDLEASAAQTAAMQKTGCQVETASDRKSALAAVRQNSYDLVVLGPTLSKNDRHHLAYMVKKANQSTRLLVLHTDGERHPAVDAHLDTGCSVEFVIAKITSMLPQAQPAARAASAGR